MLQHLIILIEDTNYTENAKNSIIKVKILIIPPKI